MSVDIDSSEQGSYVNPILDVDYSDPDAIRVGDEYWMTASSFNHVPGLPILRSTDLVTWEHVTNALPELEPKEHYQVRRPGCGVWAPSIRFHDGKYWIVYPDPDQGIFVITATHPSGPWSSPHCLIAAQGIIDPCPLWDEDGTTYLIFGWAASRSGIKNRLSLVTVDEELTRVTSPVQTIIDGDQIPGSNTLEGPKIYKSRGWYWIFAPAGGVEDGWQSVFRSRSMQGPWEHRVVLAQGNTKVNGPHQGAWVDTPDGEDYFIHFQEKPLTGRITHLQPITWTPDGWPLMGHAVVPAGHSEVVFAPGQPVLQGRKPVVHAENSNESAGPGQISHPTGSLGAQDLTQPWWFWQSNPQDDWLKVSEGLGGKRHHLKFVTETHSDLRASGAIRGRRAPGEPWQMFATLEVPTVPNTSYRTGLVVLGREYIWVGVESDANQNQRLVCRASGHPSDPEIQIFSEVLTPEVTDGHRDLGTITIGMRMTKDEAFEFSITGDATKPQWKTTSVPLTKGKWVGTVLGVFASMDAGESPEPNCFVDVSNVSLQIN